MEERERGAGKERFKSGKVGKSIVGEWGAKGKDYSLDWGGRKCRSSRGSLSHQVVEIGRYIWGGGKPWRRKVGVLTL